MVPAIRPKFFPLIHSEAVAVQRSWLEALRSEAVAVRNRDDAIRFLNLLAADCERALEVGQ